MRSDAEPTFSLWAPTPSRVRVQVDGAVHEMRRAAGGWWHAHVAEAAADSRYGFLLDDSPTPLPDPRSPRQPDGVHSLSQRHHVDPETWTDRQWTGRQLAGGVLYELHIGTFTPEGTLDSAIERLDYLADLGVTFVELMPVNGFNGTHGWGYDGVLWYTVHEPYGGPDALVRFVDACHARGLAVVLDVVYNHLGPSGNYLDRFGPYTTSANTWGQGLNLDGAGAAEVRAYIIDNALRWFDEFHIDALRLDAVHALQDSTAVHLLEELSHATERLSAHLSRPLTLIAESDLNNPRLITPRAGGGLGLHAQWDDDIHHAIHSAVSGERQGYFGDFGSMEGLANVLRHGFFHAGTYSSFRGRPHGRPLDTEYIPASALVTYTTTHDQVGNRAVGDRPTVYLNPGQLAVKAALVLCSPYTPMLFMGEEWAASTPFQFFTSHPEQELGEATARGRKAEFAEHGWDAADVPDPQDPETFTRSKLDWAEPPRAPHARMLALYTALIALRRRHRELTDPWLTHLRVDYDEQSRWIVLHRSSPPRPGCADTGRTLHIACNLGAHPVKVPFGGTPLLWWQAATVEPTGAATTVPGHSFVVLEGA